MSSQIMEDVCLCVWLPTPLSPTAAVLDQMVLYGANKMNKQSKQKKRTNRTKRKIRTNRKNRAKRTNREQELFISSSQPHSDVSVNEF